MTKEKKSTPQCPAFRERRRGKCATGPGKDWWEIEKMQEGFRKSKGRWEGEERACSALEEKEGNGKAWGT